MFDIFLDDVYPRKRQHFATSTIPPKKIKDGAAILAYTAGPALPKAYAFFTTRASPAALDEQLPGSFSFYTPT